MFTRYGTISSSKAIIDQKTGECKGYGFAMFEKEDDCYTALEGLNKAGLQASFARMGQVGCVDSDWCRNGIDTVGRSPLVQS